VREVPAKLRMTVGADFSSRFRDPRRLARCSVILELRAGLALQLRNMGEWGGWLGLEGAFLGAPPTRSIPSSPPADAGPWPAARGPGAEQPVTGGALVGPAGSDYYGPDGRP